MKAYLKTLDRAHINAPLLREFLTKDLTEASIIAINEKIKQLNYQIQVLSTIQGQLMNNSKACTIDRREDLHNDLIAALAHEDGE